jgi:putative ABC transport system permease protein
MWFVALKMLVGDKARYLGIVLGGVCASLLITQQMSIFTGIMFRTFSTVTDTGYPEIWVMDKKVQYIDDVKPLQDTKLYTVRGVEGVDWAMPFYKGLLKARLADGRFQTVNLFGLDDATLVGGPPTMVEGRLEDLRRAEGVIVDENGARGRLAKPDPAGGPPIPLRVGDVLELNDHRAVVVGICRVGRTFQSQPVIYTTYSRAVSFAPRERKLLSFIMAGVKPPTSINKSSTPRSRRFSYISASRFSMKASARRFNSAATLSSKPSISANSSSGAWTMSSMEPKPSCTKSPAITSSTSSASTKSPVRRRNSSWRRSLSSASVRI